MEETSLVSLRAKLRPEDMKVDDYCLLRFLRARKNDVDKAYAQFIEWQHFYRVNDIEHILDRVPPKLELANYVLPVATCGFSKKGHPIVYQRIGQLNAQALLALLNPTELAAIHCYRRQQQVEVMKAQSLALGRNIDRMVAVLDLAGLSWHQLAAKDLLETVFHLDERYYPESVEQILVVNAPWIFPKMFRAISWMLDPVLKAKMIVCDAYGQKATLLTYIEADQLLLEYGGTSKARVPHAEPLRVLEEVKKMEAEKTAKLDVVTAVVKPGTVLDVPVPIAAGVEVSWYVRVNGKDILFTVEYVPENEPSIFKVHPVRCIAHEGSYTATKAGTLRFHFDNQHSLFASKTVRYAITLNGHGSQSVGVEKRPQNGDLGHRSQSAAVDVVQSAVLENQVQSSSLEESNEAVLDGSSSVDSNSRSLGASLEEPNSEGLAQLSSVDSSYQAQSDNLEESNNGDLDDPPQTVGELPPDLGEGRQTEFF